ncbi:hypothetical protein CN918_30330 [Priestia megaterium]|nr:hypothetical protein CN918_30330 [Priestia megaterium]
MNVIENATRVANHIKENATEYAHTIVNRVIDMMGLKLPQWEIDGAHFMYVKFFEHLGDALSIDSYRVPEELLEWSKKNAEIVAKSGRDINDIILRYPPSRIIASNFITEICMELGGTIYGTACLIKKINAMFDISITETLMAYNRIRVELESDMLDELAALSAPYVLVEDTTYVVPLAGTMDNLRMDYIEEHLLYNIKKSPAEYVIVDFERTVKGDNWLVNQSRIIELLSNNLDIQVIVSYIARELTPVVARLAEKKGNIQACPSIAQAVEVTRNSTKLTQEHLA